MSGITTIHNSIDLDGAVASWCAEKYKKATVNIITKSKTGFPSELTDFETIYIFGVNDRFDNIVSLCKKNELVVVFVKYWDKKYSTKIPNLKLINVGSSFSRSISYKLKIPESKIVDSVECIVQKAHAPGLGRVEQYLKLCIPYDFKIIDSANRTLTERYEAAINIGRGIAIKLDHDMKSLLSRSRPIFFAGYDALIVNHVLDFDSTALALADKSKSGLGITWRCSDSETFHFTIASTEVSNIDCRSIARRNGGSGSKYKAGFKVTSSDALKAILVHMRPRTSLQ